MSIKINVMYAANGKGVSVKINMENNNISFMRIFKKLVRIFFDIFGIIFLIRVLIFHFTNLF